VLTAKLGEKTLFVSENEETLEIVLQLSNVSRPRIPAHLLNGPIFDLYFVVAIHSIEGRMLFEEIFAERSNILRALPKGWEVYGDHVQTVIKIRPECPFLYSLPEV
jgi:hypothetical protein